MIIFMIEWKLVRFFYASFPIEILNRITILQSVGILRWRA